MLRFLREAPASWLSDVQNAIIMINTAPLELHTRSSRY